MGISNTQHDEQNAIIYITEQAWHGNIIGRQHIGTRQWHELHVSRQRQDDNIQDKHWRHRAQDIISQRHNAEPYIERIRADKSERRVLLS
jgi:hypothetical protein